MGPRDVARAIAFGRIAFGVAALAAPRRVAAGWVGRDADTAGASVLMRALGVRDVVLGGMVLHTVDHPQVGRRWVATCAATDAVDGLATLAVARDLPPVRGVLGTLVAFASAAGDLFASRGLGAGQDGPAGPAATPPQPASSPEAVMPEGADAARRAMGARDVGTGTAPGSGATADDPSQPGGLQQ